MADVFICPTCGAAHDPASWHGVDEEILKLVASFPVEISSCVLDYSNMFRNPGSSRGLRKATRLKLLEEIRNMHRSGHVQIQGKVARPTTAKTWGDAIHEIFRRNIDLPLKNHNYLKKIAWSLADKADQKREKQVVRAENTGQHQRTRSKKSEGFQGITLDAMRKMSQKKGVGKKAKPVPAPADLTKKEKFARMLAAKEKIRSKRERNIG